MTVLHGLVGGMRRNRKRRGSRVRVVRHLAVCRGVMQNVTLELRQVLERWGAQGGAGGLHG